MSLIHEYLPEIVVIMSSDVEGFQFHEYSAILLLYAVTMRFCWMFVCARLNFINYKGVKSVNQTDVYIASI